MSALRVKLITGRSLGQGRSKEAGKFTTEYRDSVSLCELDPEDLKSLGLESGSKIKVKTEYGALTFKAELSKQAPHRGIAFIPYGPWASRLTSPDTQSSGMPSLKGIDAEISPITKESVKDLEELLKERG